MKLADTYDTISKSLVAFVPEITLGPPSSQFQIIGTGFVVGDGIVATNRHVADAFHQIPPAPGSKCKWPVVAGMFLQIDGGVGMVPIEVLGKIELIMQREEGYYYGPDQPDIAFVHVKAAGLQPVSLNTSPLKVGTRVATAGFPMGHTLLNAPGWLSQMGPTLQEGIVSAVLPFPCEMPHGFIANVMSHPGASGSPVFLADRAEVIGVVHAGPSSPSNFTFCEPSIHLTELLERMGDEISLPDGTQTIEEIIEAMPRHLPEKRPKT